MKIQFSQRKNIVIVFVMSLLLLVFSIRTSFEDISLYVEAYISDIETSIDSMILKNTLLATKASMGNGDAPFILDKITLEHDKKAGVYGLNLFDDKTSSLQGTYQSIYPSDISKDRLSFLLQLEQLWLEDGNDKFPVRYYVAQGEIYWFFSKHIPTNTFSITLNGTNFEKSALSRSMKESSNESFKKGVSKIYLDRNTKQNVLTIFSPVTRNGVYIGTIFSDVLLSDLYGLNPLPPRYAKNLSIHIFNKTDGNEMGLAQNSDKNILPEIMFGKKIDVGPMSVSASVSIWFLIMNNIVSIIFFIVLNIFSIYNFWGVSSVIKRLGDIANQDPLTGLYNRRVIDLFFDKKNMKINRDKTLHLIVFDLNDFKSINDTYGHTIGDDVLKIVANVLRSLCRNNMDIAIRLGGDEFCLLIYSKSNNSMSTDIVERIRMQLMEPNDCNVNITIAYGSTVIETSDTFEDAYNRADKALYLDKISLKRSR